MKILPKFPTYASANADFVTGTSRLDEGDKVVLLDKDVRDLPYGMLCMNSRTVKMIVQKLGWRLFTDEDEAELVEARRTLAAALEHIEKLEALIDAQRELRKSA